MTLAPESLINLTSSRMGIVTLLALPIGYGLSDRNWLA
jgi:hypothetical protein